MSDLPGTQDLGADLIEYTADELAWLRSVCAQAAEESGKDGVMLHLLADCYRDIYDETRRATGIDPQRWARPMERVASL